MTTDGGLATVRGRLYDAYASQHAGVSSGDAAGQFYRHDIRPELASPAAGPVADLGCGQGELVRLLLADGYDAEGIDISPEQVGLARTAAACPVRHGDYREILRSQPCHYAAVTATDFLEHLTKDEVLAAFDHVAAALLPGGVFIARAPNAVSPLGGHIRHGDFTHETSFTKGSVSQLAVAAGFETITVRPCPPVAHGVKSAGRAALWALVSLCYRAALAAETGVTRGHIVTQNLVFVARKGR